MRDVRTIGTSLLALLLWIGFAAPADARRGPDVGDIDVSTFRVGGGLRAGVAVRDTDGLAVVPTFGIDVLRERLAFESGGVEQDQADGVGIASLGVGFIVNSRFAMIPELAVPFSAADSEVTFSVRVSYAFGQ